MIAKCIAALVLVSLLVGGVVVWTQHQREKADLASGISNGTIGMMPPQVTVSLANAAFRDLFTIGFGISGFQLSPDGNLLNYRVADSGEMGCRTDAISVDPTGSTVYLGCTFVHMSKAYGSSILPCRVLKNGKIAVQPASRITTGGQPFAMTQARGKYLYVCTKDGIYEYQMNGSATPIRLDPPTVGPNIVVGALSVSHDGNFAYATNYKECRIYQFRIQPNGTLKSLSPAYIATGKGPMDARTDPRGKFVWCLASDDSTVNRFAVAANGTLTQLTSTAANVLGHEATSLVVTNDGKHAYIARYRYDSIMMFNVGDDGAFTQQSPLSIAGNGSPTTLRFDPSGKYLFAINYNDAALSIYHVNATGGLDQADPSAILIQPQCHEMAFVPK